MDSDQTSLLMHMFTNSHLDLLFIHRADNNVPSFPDRSTLASLYATGHTEGSRGVNRYAFHMARFVLKGMHVHVLA